MDVCSAYSKENCSVTSHVLDLITRCVDLDPFEVRPFYRFTDVEKVIIHKLRWLVPSSVQRRTSTWISTCSETWMMISRNRRRELVLQERAQLPKIWKWVQWCLSSSEKWCQAGMNTPIFNILEHTHVQIVQGVEFDETSVWNIKEELRLKVSWTLWTSQGP